MLAISTEKSIYLERKKRRLPEVKVREEGYKHIRTQRRTQRRTQKPRDRLLHSKTSRFTFTPLSLS